MRTMLVVLFVATCLCVFGCSQADRTVPTKDQQAGGCPGGVCPVPKHATGFNPDLKEPKVPTTRPDRRTGLLPSEPECDNPNCPVHGRKKEKAIRVYLPAWSTRCDPLMGHYLFPQ